MHARDTAEKAEKKTDTLLHKIADKRFSYAYVVGFWLTGYVAGFYLGDLIHLIIG